MHIYAFGSVCRGDVSVGSDIDLLAIVEGHDPRFDPDIYSIYSYKRIGEIWGEGNPFAWHLWLESRMLHSSNGSDHLKSLLAPAPYRHCARDCQKFFALFREAAARMNAGSNSRVFELSTIFLGVRNLASCFSLGITEKPEFSRHAAVRLGFDSLDIGPEAYSVLERARILCTRGYGENLSADEIEGVIPKLDDIARWMTILVERASQHGGIR
jgi:hypothetical protein